MDDSLSWASDDETTTVASAGMMSIGDLSSLTGAEGRGVAAKVPVGAMGESLEEDEEESLNNTCGIFLKHLNQIKHT